MYAHHFLHAKWFWIAFVLLLIFLFSGSCKQERPPVGILDEQQFTAILTDIQIVEAALNRKLAKGDNVFDLAVIYYDSLFAKYNTSKSVFDSSLAYYSRNPALMEVIYGGVITSLHKMTVIPQDTTSIIKEEN